MANVLLRGLLAAGLMTALAGVPGTADAKSTGSRESSTQASGATIEKQVSKRIRADRRLAKQDINVSVDESGEAKLTGSVTSKTAKDRAGEIAGGVKGVTQVDNQLDIRSKSGTSPSEEQGASEDQGTREEGQTGGARDGKSAKGKAAQGAEGAKETMSDSWITTKLKSQLVTAAPEASNVSVETNNGVVTLSGTVDSEAIHQRTVDIARNTDGVRDVVDNLKVVAPKAKPAQ